MSASSCRNNLVSCSFIEGSVQIVQYLFLFFYSKRVYIWDYTHIHAHTSILVSQSAIMFRLSVNIVYSVLEVVHATT